MHKLIQHQFFLCQYVVYINTEFFIAVSDCWIKTSNANINRYDGNLVQAVAAYDMELLWCSKYLIPRGLENDPFFAVEQSTIVR